MTPAGWLGTLSPAVLECVFSVMRDCTEKSQKHYETSRNLSPRYGEVCAWGVEHERAFTRGYALEEFTSALNRGLTPVAALEYVKASVRESVTKTNSRYAKEDFNFLQWGGTADAELDYFWRRIEGAASLR